MTGFESTGLARIALFVLGQAERLNLDAAELCAAAAIAETDLHDPDSRIPAEKIWRLWQLATERADGPAAGLELARSAAVRDFGIVGYTMLYAPNLRGALQRLVAYSRILIEGLRFVLDERGNVARFVLERNPGLDEPRDRTDACLAGVLGACRSLTGTAIFPVEVCLPYVRPADTVALKRFFESPLRFDQPHGALLFRREQLGLPVLTGDDVLCGYLDELAGGVLRALAQRGGFLEEVTRAIWAELSEGQPSLRRTAVLLGVSGRTLQRRLREEGTSFTSALDDLRHRSATRLLRDRSLSVADVASMLGYSEPSTFYRAFRRWRGVSPDEFRRSG